MRIQKYLSEQGVCSRRQAEAFIAAGQVLVNGKVVTVPGTQIDAGTDEVSLASSARATLAQTETVAFYKPRGVTSSRESSEGPRIFDTLPELAHLNVLGRLDKESEGLLLLSNDSALARAVTGDHHALEKEYLVTVREHITSDRIATLEPGVVLEDGPTLPVTTHWMNGHSFRIVLTEGRTHQVRRMANFLHLTVLSLKRVRMGTLTLRGLSPGSFRPLTNVEVADLKTTGAPTPAPHPKVRTRAGLSKNSKYLRTKRLC